MLKRLLIAIFFLVCPALTLAQTTIDGLINMNNVTPSAPGTTLTATILNNGTVGAGSWGSASGSALLVGAHQPGCTLGTSLSVSGVTYTPVTESQSIQFPTATNFSWWTLNYPSGHQIVTQAGCIVPGANPSNVMDLWEMQDTAGHFVIVQWIQGGSFRIETDGNGTLVSGNITVTIGNPYWVVLQDNETTGISQLAVYNAVAPFAQVGTTQTLQQKTGNNVITNRVGDSEVGTVTSPIFFENLVFDSTNGSFPLGNGNLATPSAPIITPTRAIDWSGAGVVGGIPSRTTQCGATVAAYTGSAAAVNSAISACTAGQFVSLGAGTFNLSSGIDFTGHPNVTLRGQGANQTFIVFTGNVGCNLSTGAHICVGSTDNNWKGGVSNSASWTAGYLPGTTLVTLSAVTNLKVGNPIMLDQLDDDQTGCDTGGIFVSQITTTCTVGSPTSPGVNGPYSLEGNNGGPQRAGRQQSEVHVVAGCNGSTSLGFACSGTNVVVTLAEPLAMPNWRTGQTPQAWWATSPLSGVGIEDLSYDATADANGTGIEFKNVTNSWVKGVRGIDTNRAHVQVYLSAHITVQNSYFFLTQNSATQSYGYECFTGAYDLVMNNIYHAVAGTVLQNGACIGDVIAYNFGINNFYTPSAGWNQPGMSVHTAGNDFTLYEGNVSNLLDMDVFHGTHHFITVFRNRYAGTQPACFSSGFPPYSSATYQTCNNDLIAIQVHAFSRFVNLVGNVLGTTGVTTVYNGGGTGSVYVSGNGNSNGTVTVPGDANATSTLLRWGNYDTVNAANQFSSAEVPSGINSVTTQQYFANPVPASQTLPASFFLAAKPSFWPSGKSWPGIGPDIAGGNITGVGGHANTNPAQDCWTNVMGGSSTGTEGALSFNEATCYAGAFPAMTISPNPVNFSNQWQGTQSAGLTVTVTNSGSAPLTLSTPYDAITGANAADFTDTGLGTCSNGLSISAGSSCTVILRFFASLLSTESATLAVNGNASGSVVLQGNGVSFTLAPQIFAGYGR